MIPEGPFGSAKLQMHKLNPHLNFHFASLHSQRAVYCKYQTEATAAERQSSVEIASAKEKFR